MRKLILVPTVHAEGEIDHLRMDEALKISGEEARLTEAKDYGDKFWSTIKRGTSHLPKKLKGYKVFSEGLTEDRVAKADVFVRHVQTFPRRDRKYFLKTLENPTTDADYEYLRKIHLDKTPQGRMEYALAFRGATLAPTEGESFGKAVEVLAKLTALELGEDPTVKGLGFPLSNEVRQKRKEFGDLNAERDRETAKSINQRLKQGEIGILIFGAAHNISNLLDPDIQTEFIDPELKNLIREIKEKWDFPSPEGSAGSENKG